MNRKIDIKTIIILILLVWSLTASVLWIQVNREKQNIKFQQLVDFHMNLINFSKTLDNLYEITETIKNNDLSDQERKLLSLAVVNLLSDLEKTESHIIIIEARIDPEGETFSKEFSIQDLISVIKKIEYVTKDALENETKEGFNKLNEILSITAAERAELAYNISTEEISSVNFQNKLKNFIDSMNTNLDKVYIGKNNPPGFN